MTFLNGQWIIILAAGGLLFIYLSIRYDRSYYEWIKTYWFKERRISSKVRSLLSLLGILVLLAGLLDIRGPEEIIDSQVPEQRTVIVVDTSASMLVEDVRPNRISRSLFLARHFIRNAMGHQMSIVVFSDFAKRIIPFTDDRDLLDARLMTVEGMNLETGGSNIVLAIMQAIHYLEQESQQAGRVLGNVLVFTDGEEHDWNLDSLRVPDGVTLAAVGVGTQRGGRIPLRSREGSFRGYKSFQGQEVVSKLDENFFRELAGVVRTYRYWIAHSFNLPTEEVISFFNETFENRLSDTQIRVRPVWGYPLIATGMILLIISNLMSNLRSLRTALMLVIVVSLYLSPNISVQAEVPDLSPRAIELLEGLRRGDLDSNGRIELAESLLRAGEYALARNIYEEFIEDHGVQALDQEGQVNYGSSQLYTGDIAGGIKTLKDVEDNLQNSPSDEGLRRTIRNNILSALQIQEQQQQQEDDGDSSEEGDESEEQEQDQGEGSSDEQDDSEGEEEGEQEEDDGDRDDSEDDQSPEDGDEQDSDENQDQVEQPDSSELPALIDQIMNDDRRLQQEQLDTSTREQRRGREIRDW